MSPTMTPSDCWTTFSPWALSPPPASMTPCIAPFNMASHPSRVGAAEKRFQLVRCMSWFVNHDSLHHSTHEYSASAITGRRTAPITSHRFIGHIHLFRSRTPSTLSRLNLAHHLDR